ITPGVRRNPPITPERVSRDGRYWKRTTCASDLLRHHGDRAARALLGAHAAALAVVVVEAEAVARPELDHGVVGADAVAVVALEAVAAGQAAARLVERVGLVKALLHLLEGRLAAR